jgi:hypothetical protein
MTAYIGSVLIERMDLLSRYIDYIHILGFLL